MDNHPAPRQAPSTSKRRPDEDIRRIHLVPHTHWDREWYEPFQVFRIKLVHLIDRLLEILGREPGFSYFTLDGQTIVLEDYLQVRPERRQALEAAISSGRILIGPWYILPDEFLVSGEALIRNLLVGRRLAETFGGRMEVGYLPDPFGHIAQMPQILRGFGIEYAAFRRGLGDEPVELWWQAPDGSRVLLSYLRDGYDNAARAPTQPDAFIRFVRDRVASLAPFTASDQILLMNGTDHQEPQEAIPTLLEAFHDPGLEIELSNLPRYFEALQREIEDRGLALPVVQGERRDPSRHHLLPGTLSSRVWLKQRNHACEVLLERWAEPFSAWAELSAASEVDSERWTGHLSTPRAHDPRGLLREAWRLLLSCQAHDSICGCSIDPVHREMESRFDQVEQIGEEITRQSLAALAGSMDTRALKDLGARHALVVFNPHGHAITGLARAEIELPAGLETFEIVGPEGQAIAYREIRREERELANLELDPTGLQALMAMVGEGRVMGLSIQSAAATVEGDTGHLRVALAEDAEPRLESFEEALTRIQDVLAKGSVARFHLLARFATRVQIEFLAPDIPPLGFRSFGLRPSETGATTAQEEPGHELQNGLLKVSLDEAGRLALTDLRSAARFEGMLSFLVETDRGDSYTFCPIEGEEPIIGPTARPRATRIQDALGQRLRYRFTIPLRERLDETRKARTGEVVELEIAVEVWLPEGRPYVDLSLDVQNPASDLRLKVAFPSGWVSPEAIYDGHFVLERRPTTPVEGRPEWAEQPTPEQPMRNFVAIIGASAGLGLAARGLREACVSPDGTLSLTLLRGFGWLSRDDLTSRNGGAGPKLPTPDGQGHGAHRFELRLIPFAKLWEAVREGHAFQADLRAAGTGLHDGTLPQAMSLLRCDAEDFLLTALKLPEEGEGLVARGVYLGEVSKRLHFETDLDWGAIQQIALDERTLSALERRPARAFSLLARPKQILSFRLDPA